MRGTSPFSGAGCSLTLRMTSSLGARKMKVLVIDDDPIVLEVTRERLARAGYDVLVREESLGTTQVVREEQPDVLLLDLLMPALNGERIAALLKGNERTRHVTLILHSSKSQDELNALVPETGAVGAISKGKNDRDFLEAFARLAHK